MCGIFGIVYLDDVQYPQYRSDIKSLYKLSESRGKEAAGICLSNISNITVHKAPVRAKDFIRSKIFKNMLQQSFHDYGSYRLVMGHTRMITNGSATDDNNNQPISFGSYTCLHNGIIVNDDEVWRDNNDIIRESEVDTEILVKLVEKHGKRNIAESFLEAIKTLKGSLSVSMISNKSNELLLFTNVGSLYYSLNMEKKRLVFASERYILEQFMSTKRSGFNREEDEILNLKPNTGLVFNLKDLAYKEFEKNDVSVDYIRFDNVKKLKVVKKSPQENHVKNTLSYINETTLEKNMQINIDAIKSLKRCSRCLLPETFPGIKFDDNGVCSECNSYKPVNIKGIKELKKVMAKCFEGETDDSPNCLIPISGGRDSCFALHYAVKELGLKPIAYTYDWGMVTDLARRNIQRMCAKLEIEHILISADIKKKRNNIRKNVEAWLKKPTLGTIPLFMAGDKHFFYYAQLLKKQMNLSYILFGMNPLEATNFKVGFSGIETKGEEEVHYDLSIKDKCLLVLYYLGEVVKNPAYINFSIFDTLKGFISYYLLPKDYIQLYDYLKWDEKKIVDCLINEYEWETADDTKSTWRIGDGTAAFYNYIYYKFAGFTEFDTFRSNQIREGLISRETALKNLYDENTPRIKSFDWYCQTIGIDTETTLRTINGHKKTFMTK